MRSDWYASAPLVIAHRGASAFAPENTLAAFRRAAELGADAIELDAKLTRDGTVVCHHDRTLERTTNGSGRVRDHTWDEIRRLDAGTHFSDRFAGEPIPSLEDVLRECGRSLLVNVELTNYGSPTDTLPSSVVSLVARLGAESRVLISSFNTIALRACARLSPRLPLALLLRKDQGPLRRVLFPLLAPHEALHLGDNLAGRAEVQRALGRALRVHVWTVNTPERIRELVRSGVHGVITDAPDLARRALSP
jgi:glycerophosphoryl diester phosphodiesterase